MRTRLVTVFLFISLLFGCGQRGSEKGLVDMAVEVNQNSNKIQALSVALEGVNTRLARIEQSLEQLGKPAAQMKGTTSALSPAEMSTTLEDMSKQVISLQGELASAKQELASTQGVMKKMEWELAKPKGPDDIGAAIRKLAAHPDAFVNALDLLAANVSGKIADPVTRQNFEADIARLRDRALTTPSTDELYQELRARHVEKLNLVTQEEHKRDIEREISRLDNCSEEELQERVTEYWRDRTAEEVFGIAKTYRVEKEDFIAAWFPPPGSK